MTIPEFQETILSWYKDNKRDLPWRNTRDPYAIMVSEIMLQQTQVSRVLPKYKEFLETFPSLKSLARSKDSDLLKIWSGLGYWRRARFLKEACQKIIQNHEGFFPRDPDILRTLPGIGPYTAGAISCFAFDNTDAFVDTNIRRTYLHFFFQNQTGIRDSDILTIAQKAVPEDNPRDWHYALFDYGSLVLKDKKINQKSHHYAKQSKFTGSFRSYRTKLLRNLLEQPEQSMSEDIALDLLETLLREDERDFSPKEILESLITDKLVKTSGTRIFL